MNAQLLASVEREVLAWSGVNKEEFEGGRGQGGLLVPPATLSGSADGRSGTSITQARRTCRSRARFTTN